jgi:hypothetical protein
MKPIPVKYTWDEGPRRFRDHFGRFVKRTEVRKGLDRYVDKLQAEAGLLTERLAEGEIDLARWQKGMADMIKRGHSAATMIARGGKVQVRKSDWGRTGQIIRRQYQYLQGFANELEAGLPITGRVINRAKMYAVAPTGTYENMLREDDIKAGFDVERRILHSVNPCKSCVRYRNMGWQPAGKLPGIGQRCQCKSRCRCTFERYRSSSRRPKFGSLFYAGRLGLLRPRHGGLRQAAAEGGVAGFGGGGSRSAPPRWGFHPRVKRSAQVLSGHSPGDG